MSQSDLSTLAEAGILQRLDDGTYRVARGWECFFDRAQPEPTETNRPEWAYTEDR